MGGRRKGGRGVVVSTTDHLTPLMESFCVAYVQQSGRAAGADAAVAAGSLARADGAPGNPASVQATRWLKMPKIQARIAQLRAQAAAPIVAQLTRKILSLHECQEILSTHVVTPGRRTPAAVAAAQLLLRTIPGAIAAQEAHLTGEVTLKLAYDGGRTPRPQRQELPPAQTPIDASMVQDSDCTDAPETESTPEG